jgi:hypothetical protein
MGHPKLFAKRINLLLPDFFEMEEKKSQIFSLPFQKNQVTKDNKVKIKLMITHQKIEDFLMCDHQFYFYLINDS